MKLTAIEISNLAAVVKFTRASEIELISFEDKGLLLNIEGTNYILDDSCWIPQGQKKPS